MSAGRAGFCVCCGHQLAEYTAAPGTLGLVCRECADPMPPGSVVPIALTFHQAVTPDAVRSGRELLTC